MQLTNSEPFWFWLRKPFCIIGSSIQAFSKIWEASTKIRNKNFRKLCSFRNNNYHKMFCSFATVKSYKFGESSKISKSVSIEN